MTATIREQILQKFEDVMKGVVKAQAFNTDIGHEVYRSRRTFFEEELPAATLIDGPEVASRDNYGGDFCSMEVSIQILINEETDDTYSKIINSIVGEFRFAIEQEDSTFGGLADDTQYTGFTPVYPEEGLKTIAAEITYKIDYTTCGGDPYSVLNP